MKKVFNLSVILAVLMAAFSFSSCSKDDDDAASITMTAETTPTGAIVAITCEEEINSLELFEGSNKIKNITVPTATSKSPYVYAVTLTGLTTGTKYSLKAISESGENSVEFTPGKNAETFPLSIGGSGNTSVGSYISIKNEKVYKASEANANAAAIEIVFDGTNFKSAKESGNSSFTAVASATVTMNGNGCSFETSTGYTGTIVANETLGDAAKTYTVTVSKIAK